MRLAPLLLKMRWYPQRDWLAVFFFLSVFLLAGAQAVFASPELENTNTLKVIGRSEFEGTHLELSDDDWAWVRSKRVIVLGTAAPGFAPLEIVSNGMYYEGISADVVDLIGKLLHVEVRVVQFPDRAAALNALARGLVDIVGSASSHEPAAYHGRLTGSYVSDQLVLYVRKSEMRSIPSRLDGMRIAVADDYLPLGQLKTAYPAAEFVAYRSREQALAALAFGNADLYLGDAISSNYFVNLNYFNDVRMLSRLDIPAGGFAFVVHVGADRLGSVLNSALEVVRREYSAEILKRWSGGGG
ncbi:transporter substrate-binding domain-containing protein [Pseudomonas sp. AOB-7]|uniref:transporter substrate-binding domain-containing protein n=1 Tax=Pseudomonas sp. AOB-7 TaxID=2482750 RepID=UPI002114B4B0|nr:transporter substrate-binding domain-containing protein [Pseudomonas sp. AOB-7]